jgi:periplasmic divalent cation tolerance protein
VIVLTTLSATTDATPFARVLVERGLAACVNILPPMTSIYRWKGAVEEDTEQQLLIKTTADRVQALQEHFNTAHPYEVAEFLVVPISEGSAAYVGWLLESLALAPPAPASAPAPGQGGTERS